MSKQVDNAKSNDADETTKHLQESANPVPFRFIVADVILKQLGFETEWREIDGTNYKLSVIAPTKIPSQEIDLRFSAE